jgi:hypothetical protein
MLGDNVYTDHYQVVDGIRYYLQISSHSGAEGSILTVTDNPDDPYTGDIVIPETVEITYYWHGSHTEVFTVKSISPEAFRDCTGLTSITIPASVESMVSRETNSWPARGLHPENLKTENPFVGCTNLQKIVVKEGNTVFDSREDCNAIIETAKNELIVACKNSIIPNSVTSYGRFSFSCRNDFTKLQIPENIHGIREYAFYKCTNLTTVNVNDCTIEANAFEGCTNLTSIVLNRVSIDNYAFSDCVNLKSIEFTGSFINADFKSYAFNGCHNITTISLNVNYLPEATFFGCNKLEDVFLYKKPTLARHGGSTYGVDEDFPAFDESAKNATLHVRDVDIEAFKADEAWSMFKEIVPIEKVTDFNLIYYVDGDEYKTVQYKYNDEVTPLEEPVKDGYTFSGWSEIPEKMPGKDVKVEGKFVRNEVKENNIVYWTLNDQAAVIGNDNAAGEVKIASSVTFNERSVPVTDIVDFSFKNNTDITSVVIPESVRKIGDEAFSGCKNLSKLELGKSVNQIEPRAFAGIDKLEEVIVYAENVPDADRTAFENSYIEDYVTLHVPGKALDKFKDTAPWKNFKEIVAIEGTESEPAKYTLIYQVDGETYQKFELEEGEEITALEEPTKEGYTFSGWSTIPATMPAEDVTIIGTFTKNEPKEEEVDTGEDVIKITSAGQTTWCSKHDLDFTDIEGLKAYIAPGYDRESGTIWLMRVFKVPAGEGILLMGDAKEYKVPHKPTTTYYTNMFVGTTEPKTIYESEGEYTNYYLSSGTSGVGFYRVTDADGVQLKANRAYLPLKTSTQASTRGFVGMEFGDDGTTGMRNLTPALSKGEGVYYNLQGQRVDKPGKGLYILNGKKVVVK